MHNIIPMQNEGLLLSYSEEKSFRKSMQISSKRFVELEQQAFYADFSTIKSGFIIGLPAPSEMDPNLFIIFGRQQPPDDHLKRFLLYFITKIPRPCSIYSLVYVNTLSAAQKYGDFRRVLEQMPIEYFIHLRAIYVLEASLSDKAAGFFSFGTILSFIKHKTMYLNSYQQLCHIIHLSEEGFRSLVPKQLLEEYNKGASRKRKASGNDMKLKRNPSSSPPKVLSASKSDTKRTETPLRIKAVKMDICDYEMGQLGIPLIIEVLLYTFKEVPDFQKVEGLFRKCSSIDAETEALEELHRKNYNYLKQVVDPHLLANLLKRIISNFKTPLVPYEQYQLLMTESSKPNFKITLVKVIKNLPKIRYMTLLCVLEFIVKQVMPFSDINKMNAKNLAICVGPSFMWAEERSMRDLIDVQKIMSIMLILITQFDQIFGNEKQVAQTYRRSFKEQKRKSQKQVELFQQEKSDSEEVELHELKQKLEAKVAQKE